MLYNTRGKRNRICSCHVFLIFFIWPAPLSHSFLILDCIYTFFIFMANTNAAHAHIKEETRKKEKLKQTKHRSRGKAFAPNLTLNFRSMWNSWFFEGRFCIRKLYSIFFGSLECIFITECHLACQGHPETLNRGNRRISQINDTTKVLHACAEYNTAAFHEAFISFHFRTSCCFVGNLCFFDIEC